MAGYSFHAKAGRMTQSHPTELDTTSGQQPSAAEPRLHWIEADTEQDVRWRSEAGVAPPKRVVLADDRIPADSAYHLACEGTALLWAGDYQNARQLLQAMGRRIGQMPDRKARRRAPSAIAKAAASAASAAARVAGRADAAAAAAISAEMTAAGASEEAIAAALAEHAAGAADRAAAAAASAAAPAPAAKSPSAIPVAAFHAHRLAQAQRARTLGNLLIPLDGDYTIPLRRAPDVVAACTAVWGPPDGEPSVVSLRELLGLVGAYEWRRNGVEVGPLGAARIHPHYGVFSPVRGEYLTLMSRAPLPDGVEVAFDIGTGTGVVAALLARRGVARVVATDIDPRALVCAKENLDRLGFGERVRLEAADLFPQGRAKLIVCNPPWLPGKPASPIERAIFDPDSRMLKGFLAGLADHLAPGGEGWLVMSNFAEHLGLRARGELEAMIEAAGLSVVAKTEMAPRHPKALDPSDPLHAARVKEVTRLYRLAVRA